MARTRSLSNLLSDVRKRADIERMTDRHPDSDLTRYINESIQALREIVSRAGHEYYLTSTTGTVSSETIALPSDFVRMHALFITVSGYEYQLEPYEQREDPFYRDDPITPWNPGYPASFRVYGSSIHVLPVPTTSYPYRLLYVPTWTDLSGGTDEFDGVAGWEDWVVLDVCCRCILPRDEDPNGSYGMLSAERARVEQRILDTAPKRQRVAPGRRMDVRGMRRATAYLRRFA